jgi:hypothetical protein
MKFLFGLRGFYRDMNGSEQPIGREVLPRKFFNPNQGLEFFAMLRNAVDRTKSYRIIEAGRWVFFSGLLWDLEFWPTFMLFIQSIGCDIAALGTARPGGGIGLINRLGKLGDSLDTRMRENWLVRAPKKRVLKAAGANLTEIWCCLEEYLPAADYQAKWVWQGILPEHIPSMPQIAAGYSTSLSSGALHDLPLANPSLVRLQDYSSSEADFPEVTQAVFEIAIGHVRRNTTRYEPSLSDILIANDYDLCRSRSSEAAELYDLGYRHAALYFFEVHILFSAAIGAAIYFYIRYIGIHLFLWSVRPVIAMAQFIVNLHLLHWVTSIILLMSSTIWVPILGTFLFFSLFITGHVHLINFTLELVLARPFVRAQGRLFLTPMLLGRTKYTGFNYKQIYGAFTKTTSNLLFLRFWPSTQQPRRANTFQNESQSGRHTAAIELDTNENADIAQQRREVEEDGGRGQRAATVDHQQENSKTHFHRGKEIGYWIYHHMLVPSFTYSIIKPLELIDRVATWDANFARQSANRRHREQCIRESGLNDTNLGEEELEINLLDDDGEMITEATR